MFAYDEALAAYGRALECAEALGRTDEQLALEEEMGRLLQLAGETLAALGHFERALVHAADPVTRARLQCEAAQSLVTVGDERGLVYLQEARAVLDPAEHPVEMANAFTVEGRFHHLGGRHRAAIELLESAVELLAPLAESEPGTDAANALVLAYGYLAGAHQHLGLFDDADQWARRALEYGVAHRQPAAEALGYEFLAEDAALAGRWQEALTHVAREQAIAERIHSRERLAWTYLPAAISELALGHPARAHAEIEQGVALARVIGERRLAPFLEVYRSMAVADLGQPDEALRAAREALDGAEQLGLPFIRTEARRCLAYVHYARGEWEAAIRVCNEVLEMLDGREPAVSKLLMGPLHVRALVAARRFGEARVQLAAFEELAARSQSRQAVSEASELWASM